MTVDVKQAPSEAERQQAHDDQRSAADGQRATNGRYYDLAVGGSDSYAVPDPG